MNISDRLLQYLEHKGISRAVFYKTTGLGNGYLDKKPNIGADKIERIVDIYSDLSLYWLITGHGDMLSSGYGEEEKASKVGEPPADYGKEALKPIEIISKLVLQNETLIAIIDRHTHIIQNMSSKFND